MNLVVFDLDGTLVESESFEGELYARAVRTELGIAIDTDWSCYRHVTDSGILDEVLDRSRSNADRSMAQAAVMQAFTELVADHVAAHDGLLPEIPGASDFVNALIEHPGVQVAVATGGWRETALIKLQAIGIEPGRLPIASSSDAMSKADIIRVAERRALPEGGATRRTYVGDSYYDLEMSRQVGYEFMAIGPDVVHRQSQSDFCNAELILGSLGLRC
ncbi:MAG: HAD family hydrolase [Chloroflexi bacterium]|nr:HAD family hydrolase [Chloroflexota bacterium]